MKTAALLALPSRLCLVNSQHFICVCGIIINNFHRTFNPCLAERFAEYFAGLVILLYIAYQQFENKNKKKILTFYPNIYPNKQSKKRPQKIIIRKQEKILTHTVCSLRGFA